MKNLQFLLYAFIFLFIFQSCSSLSEGGHDEKALSSFQGERVLLLDPFFLQDILGIAEDEEIYVKNLYIGNIEFSGGVIRTAEKGMMLETKNISFNRQSTYREKALQSFSKQIRAAADSNKYNAVYLERAKLQDIITKEAGSGRAYGDLRFTVDYREHKDDEKDNINLPWYLFSVTSLSPELTTSLGDTSGAHYILVPIIEHYYSHSAGWFNDQWAGCGAGLRITYHIVIFDLNTGGVVFHFSETEKYLEEFTSRISEFLLFQEFSKIEKKIQKTLLRTLPRS